MYTFIFAIKSVSDLHSFMTNAVRWKKYIRVYVFNLNISKWEFESLNLQRRHHYIKRRYC